MKKRDRKKQRERWSKRKKKELKVREWVKETEWAPSEGGREKVKKAMKNENKIQMKGLHLLFG